MEFRLARAARDRYAFEDTLFSLEGDALAADRARAERLAERIAPASQHDRARVATDLAAIGLIHELGHRAVAVERRRQIAGGGPLGRALTALDVRLGAELVDETLTAFEGSFPASAVYRGELTPAQRLSRPVGSIAGREAALEELALTWVGIQNPAAAAYRELVDDAPLAATPYPRLVRSLSGADLPPDEPDPDRAAPARSLIDRLLEPQRAAPLSLAGQLRWIRIHWAGWLDEADLLQIDRQLVDLDAEARAAWLRSRRGPPGDGGHIGFAGFGDLGHEPEGFSEDRDWMAELVLVAKSTYVWLEQLSRTHGRHIHRLDHIPDEELDELRERGFTGLWLIGLWERSQASRTIKQRRGNPDAMASAYSVSEYRIADELGGDEAWRDLRDRAAARGLRLAADMVPNHMGIDSRWVVEHPERFISSPYPPYEAYRFDGPDLSSDGRVVLQIEDHYWDSSDAAVVFRRIDRASGETRYIYHGNDGTSFPWNDTAQLDYLDAGVREAVIGQILEVARRFHVIRFDAAMVLAQRHIQRLWYPLPGHEAGIPSRSAAALPAAEFLRRMPREFWREVVDRVAAEVPDTLLLAEAFWLLEGYFVRTLGMHRVYNSAFMHMLRDERNAEYQKVIRETIAFDARILGRYVNFMNNPDERSAVDQFGSHDKYSGVATLLATLPGLPMFGHGQVEGFAERYGMEFRRPMWDERPDQDLIARHRREIFPLLRQRWRFAGAEHFRQLVARDGAGEVADVFAYANRATSGPVGATEARSLVVYLNRYQRAHVHIPGVAEALGLPDDPEAFLILHDERSGLDYLRSLATLRERGLELSLDGYRCHVFLGFEVVGGPGWAGLAWRLGLDGVPDAHAAMRRLRDEPQRTALAALLATQAARAVFAPVPVHGTVSMDDAARQADPSAEDGAPTSAALPRPRPGASVVRELREGLERLAATTGRVVDAESAAIQAAVLLGAAASLGPRRIAAAVGAWALVAAVAEVVLDADPARAADAFEGWDGPESLGATIRAAGGSDADAWRGTELARALLRLPPGALEEAARAEGLPLEWLVHETVRAATGWNEWQAEAWLSREAWDELVDALAERDVLLAVEGAREAAAELRHRAAALGYRAGGRPRAAGAGADGTDAQSLPEDALFPEDASLPPQPSDEGE